jgi:RimJ/RimL family protein N-acetyltransferase/predicted GNAT family acetyltransferase
LADAARIRAFRHALDDAAAERVDRYPWGTAVHSPSIGNVYDMNFLRVERGRRGARSLAREADEIQAHLFHRRVVLDRGAASAVVDFKELGWAQTTHLVMLHRRELDRRVDTSLVRELPFEELTPVREAATLREPWADEELAARLVEAKRRIGKAVPLRNFAAVVRGKIAAYCELRCGDGVAQIEDVNTLEEYRGSGLGRAVVQHALDEASREHDLVFLEALADDWPRHLYAKLGFDVVDERRLFTRYPHPLTQLRLSTPRLELRLATRAELRELAEVARRGIHRRQEMPFAVAWTDNADAPRFVDDFVEFHEDALARWRKGDWTLNLIAFHEGRPIGTQGMGAKGFARKRVVGTGSWLGRRWQRRGLGTEMRAAVLELAFRGLGAETATTGFVEGNRASLAVSRKLGYVDAGTATVAPRGEPLVEHKLKRSRRGWQSPVPIEITGLDDVRSLFGA